MNTFKSTSPRRPSQATLDQSAAFDRQFAESRAWGALIAVHRMIAHAIDINARAAELERTGAQDAEDETDLEEAALMHDDFKYSH